jgi:hypothetical protein
MRFYVIISEFLERLIIMTLEDKLRDHLKYYKLCQIAKLADVSLNSLSLFKNGHLKSMSIDTYQKITDALREIGKKAGKL